MLSVCCHRQKSQQLLRLSKPTMLLLFPAAHYQLTLSHNGHHRYGSTQVTETAAVAAAAAGTSVWFCHTSAFSGMGLWQQQSGNNEGMWKRPLLSAAE